MSGSPRNIHSFSQAESWLICLFFSLSQFLFAFTWFFFFSFHFAHPPQFFIYFLLFLSISLGKSASVFHMRPLLNILCHGARFPVFENNPSSCIINLERACQSTWCSATPHPLLPSPGTFWFDYPQYTIPSTGNCGSSRGISVHALADCRIFTLPLTVSLKRNPIRRCPSGK